MIKKFVFFSAFLYLVMASGLGAVENPVAVSPGHELRASVVDGICPTFSWAQVPGVSAYQIAVFEMSERYEGLSYYESQAALNQPVLIKEIPGTASSWTPSMEQALQNGGRYVWFVQSQDTYGRGTWSVGKKFAVRAPMGLTEIREKVKKQLEARGVEADLIDEAFRGIQSGGTKSGKGGELKGKEQSGEKKETQSKVKTQGNKEIRGKENQAAQGTTDFTASTLGSEGDANHNVYYGSGAGNSLPGSSAYSNAFFGYQAGYSTDSGDSNTFMGYYAGSSNTIGNYNTFMGDTAGLSNTTGNYNTFIGNEAGYNNTTSYNTFIGYRTGYSNTTGTQNTFIGSEAGYLNTASFNTFMGYYAGYSNTSGHNNTFLGRIAGYSNTTGENNTFIGSSVGYSNTTGYRNTCVGRGAGYNNEDGHYNVFIGYLSGNDNVSGDDNTYLGTFAGSHAVGNRNIFLGFKAGLNETGSHKLYIENSDSSAPLIYGEFDNDLVIVNGELFVTDSNINVDTTATRARFKLQADGGGVNQDDFFNFTMRNDYGDVTLSVRDSSAGIWLPLLSYEYLNNKVDFKDNDIVTTGTISSGGGAYTSGGAWIEASSRDYKENIMELDQDESLQALESLNPVRYNYKNNREEEFLGFIAEDVPDLVAMNGRKGMRAMDIVAVLTKVVQNQQKKNCEYEKLLGEQNELINKLIKRIEEIEHK